jgi:8-oxo-dGTP pyrophosphatase MutT (NUDIX family)
MADLNERLLEGTNKLLQALGPDHPGYRDALTFQFRLAVAIDEQRRYGQTERNRANLAHVVEQLNRLCLDHPQLGQDFNQLCGIAPRELPAVRAEGSDQLALRGAILYANVMGFSTLAAVAREQAVDWVRQRLGDLVQALDTGYWLSFRGGDFLLFLDHKRGDRRAGALLKAFFFGLHLQLQAQQSRQPFKLGVLVHWEDSARQYYVDSGTHLIGAALDQAQLLMSFSDDGHFFVSKFVDDYLQEQFCGPGQADFDELFECMRVDFGAKYPSYPQPPLSQEDCEFRRTRMTFHDRHKRQHEVVSLYIRDPHLNVSIGSLSSPQHLVPIEYRDPREALDPQQKFIQRLVEADDVSIIGLTHEGTAEFLKKALEIREQQRLGFWQQLQIVFPSQPVLNTIIEEHRVPEERCQMWKAGRSSVFAFLLAQGPDKFDHWVCLEYNGNLPFVGNRFVSRRNTSVRVAPILPGGNQKKTFYMEVFEGMPAYEQLLDAFSVISHRSMRVVEWNIYGRLAKGEFRYQGLVNRLRLGTRKQYCFPVALIMLHAETEKGHCSILQKRTIYNAFDDVETYSNISGRVIDLDVFAVKAKSPDEEYFERNYREDQGDFNATRDFNRQAGMARNEVVELDVWQETANREIREELGLDVTRNPLVHRTSYLLPRDDGDLLFQIFSLKLARDPDCDELEIIQKRRPHVSLSDFDYHDLVQFQKEGRFNRLLQHKFEEVFLPIFCELEIEGSPPSAGADRG